MAGVQAIRTDSTAGRGVRDRYNAFVERNEVAWELTMAALAVVFVAIGFAADEARNATLLTVEMAITFIFVAEFGSRFAASHNRRGYLRAHWLDLAALIPALRQFRLLRLLRLLRLIRALVGVHRALMKIERLVAHRQMVGLIVIWFGVMLLTSLGMFAAEHGINKKIESPFDAVWWGVVTMATVGYGDVVPVTMEGRIAGIILIVLGIALFGVITATATSVLLRQDTPAEAGADTASTDAAVPTTGPEVTLRNLAALTDEGILTAEEFATAKARLLARL